MFTPKPRKHRLIFWLAILGWMIGSSFPSHSAQGKWTDTYHSGMFEVRSEFSLAGEAGNQLLEEISRLKSEIEGLLNFSAEETSVEVNLFRNRLNYQNYLRNYVPQAVGRTALYVKGSDKGRVYVYRRLGYEKDLRHECTHAVLHNLFPHVPIWLDEGLAVYFEVPAADRASGSPHLKELKRRLLFGWKPDLKSLESHKNLNEIHASEYRESWAWIHFFLHGPQEVRQIFSDYLYEIHSGNSPGKLDERLRTQIPDVDSRLVSHIRNWPK